MKRKLLIFIVFIILSTVGVTAADEFVPLKCMCNGKSLSTAYEYHGNLYITLEDFEKYGNTSNFTVDKSKNQIFFDPVDFDIHIADKETTDFIQSNVGTVHVSMRGIGSTTYVPLIVLSDLAELKYELQGEKLTLYPQASTEGLYKVNQTCTVVSSLVEGNGKSYTISPSAGVFFSIKKDFGIMSLVELLSGDTVYIMNDCIVSADDGDGDELPVYVYNSREKADYGRKFNMAWDQNPKASPEAVEGIDVIAPFEWFYPMVGQGGTLGNNANVGYCVEAHEYGYRVWATATNAFTTSGSTNFTLEIFKDEDLLNKVCAQYLFYCALYDVDGLNVDYEDLRGNGVKAGLTKMMTILGEYTSRMGLDLSVSTLVPESWNLNTYDYAALGKCCDYVIPMTYDEHYSLSSGMGSTSSRKWYTRNMKTLCEYVPSEKILMGTPLFCFICNADGNGNFVSCNKNSMYMVLKSVRKAAKNGSILEGPTWIEEDGQYYVKYADGDKTVKVWLEDTRSMAQRLACVNNLDLAGTACWSMDHMTNDFFEVFSRVYKDGTDPDTITPDYPLEAQ